MPIVCSIDLVSLLGKYSFILSHLDLKSTPKHGNCIPLPPSTAVRIDGNFNEFPWFWRLSVQLGIICARHTPLNFHIWISKGQDQSADLREKARAKQLTCLKVKPIYHIWENMCFWRSRLVIWPPLSPSCLLFHFDLELGGVTPNLCWIVDKYIYKINSKSKWKKCVEIQLKNTVFYGPQVRKFYLIVKVGYYPLMPLTCASV